MKIQVIKKADKKPSGNHGCMWMIELLPEPKK
jgi:hypothetical protein